MNISAIAAISLLLAPLGVSAQVSPDSGVPTASALAAAVWSRGGNLILQRVLRQMDGPVSRARLDELADSLTAFAIRTDPDSIGVAAISVALNALGAAAVSRGAGIPYAGAAPRLMRIAEQGKSGGSGALYFISRLPDRQEAMRLLKYSAALDRPGAMAAVRYLDDSMGPEGKAALKLLYERGDIRNRFAVEQAEVVAQRERWIAPPARPRQE